MADATATGAGTTIDFGNGARIYRSATALNSLTADSVLLM